MFFLRETVLAWRLLLSSPISRLAQPCFLQRLSHEITTRRSARQSVERGFAYGYLGGGLLLALNFLLVKSASRLGLDPLWLFESRFCPQEFGGVALR